MRDLITAVDPSCGITFFVMPPDGAPEGAAAAASLLADLNWPVQQVSKRTLLHAGTIYVLPAQASARLDGAHIALDTDEASREPRIDALAGDLNRVGGRRSVFVLLGRQRASTVRAAAKVRVRGGMLLADRAFDLHKTDAGTKPGAPSFAPDHVGSALLLGQSLAALARVGSWEAVALEEGTIETTTDGALPELASMTSFRLANASIRALSSAPGVFYARQATPTYGLVDVGSTIVELTGHAPRKFLADAELFDRMIDPEDRPRVFDARSTLQVGHSTAIAYRVRCADGTVRWLRDDMRLAEVGRDRQRILGVLTDVTDLRRIELAHAESEQRFRVLVETAPHAMVIHDDDSIVMANRRAADLLGIDDRAALIGRDLSRFMAPDVRGALRGALTLRPPGRRPIEPLETKLIRFDGAVIDVEIASARIADGQRMLWQSVLRNVTERKRTEAEIRHRVSHDALTGLPNRALFAERLEAALAQSRRNQAMTAVMMLDLDNFKTINDRLGHDAGDELLIAVAERLRSVLRETDTLARLGGDEMAVVQTGLDRVEGAATLARRMVEAITKPVRLSAGEVMISTSIGISLAPQDGTVAEILLKNADLALYRAKADGRGRYCFFTQQMNQALQERQAMARALRQAMGTSDLQVLFQSQVELATGKRIAAEALMRWRHKEQGMVPPDKFIPIAEDEGIIPQLGQWVLHEACAALKRLEDASGDVRVAVNISLGEIRRGDLVASVTGALHSCQLAPECLELEIQEKLLFGPDSEAIAPTIATLADMGVRIVVDDFGTGASALSALKRSPAQKVKIDRSLVAGIGCSSETEEILCAAVSLAKALGKTVVAEGVETRTQLDVLQELGCDAAQGYLFGRPDGFAGLMRTQFDTGRAASTPRIAAKPATAFPSTG
ncbi:MAG: putative bifunctional diguanylate cyclase/phosphodiesterase [Geminicoccaceae bacterium]